MLCAPFCCALNRCMPHNTLARIVRTAVRSTLCSNRTWGKKKKKLLAACLLFSLLSSLARWLLAPVLGWLVGGLRLEESALVLRPAV